MYNAVGADMDVGPTPVGGGVMRLDIEDAKLYDEIQRIKSLRNYYVYEYNEKWGYFLYLMYTKYGFDPDLYRWRINDYKIKFQGMY